MKRPGPLPPRQHDDAPEEAAGEWDEPAPRGRSRLADLVPFARRGSEGEQFSSGDADDAEPVDDAASDGDLGHARSGGWLGRLRERGGRRRVERQEVRRFTAAARRRRNVRLAAVGVAVLIAGGAVGAAYSPLFAVERVLVIGAEAIDAAEVQRALDDQVGRPLPTVDHDEIREGLGSFPLIETYAVEARPPHELVIRITERTPIAVVESEAGFTTVDAAGVPLATSEERPGDLPTVDAVGGPTGDAFAAVGQVLRALPEEMAARVTHAEASSPDDVSFDLPDGGGVTVVWGSPEDTATKIEVLERAFEVNPPSEVSQYDVSSEGVLVVG